MIAQFEQDPETELIVMVGEIGGDEEERTADYIGEHVTKPVVAYIAGFEAPPGKRMGHAGAIISGSSGTAQAKAEALEAKGVPVGRNPTEAARLAAEQGRGEGSGRAVEARGRSILTAVASPAPISFARGAPSLDIMPAADVRAAARARARREDPAGALSYGPGYGYGPLREWIAERHGVEPERVRAVQRLARGGADAVRPPGRARRPGDRRGALLRPHAARARDARSGAVRRAAAKRRDRRRRARGRAGGRPARPSFAHIIPNFHNPAGCTLSQTKRERLLELASEYEFVIFEDDPYRDVRFEGEDLPTMLSRDTDDRVVYASSFSKTIAPGVRVGYLIGPGT